tara:strand:- start:949 stop:1392 length:444 start_codon:yes stop_codon:yes gene_type:complete
MPSPKDTNGPIVKSGPTKGENRSRNDDGAWRKKRNDAGKSRNKKEDSGCFITTAVCSQRGLPDNCYELTVLRKFRDDYLLSCDEGSTLVSQYYKSAPDIARKLTNNQDLAFAWERISECITHIENKKYSEAITSYRNMFNALSAGRN